MTPLDSQIEAGKLAFLAILTLVPASAGILAAKVGGVAGWIIFGVCAVPLGLFVIFGEAMRSSTNSTGIDAYWHFIPIACLIIGRVIGAYSG